jgi:SAM-dependent methyltransferase
MPQLQHRDVYELSARGALYQWLQRQGATLTGSEYFPNVASGNYCNGVLCQDVQALSFADNSFDLCTSTDVFEHVADDYKGFVQIARVLKPGGVFIFTVPLTGGEATIERARVTQSGSIEHLLPPEYHGDPVGQSGRILALRNYGNDIVERLCQAGFSGAEIIQPRQHWFGSGRAVVVATK